MKPEEINIASIAAQFSDEEAAWGFMEELRWSDGPVCPHCGSIDSAHLINSAERKTRKGHRTYRREWTCQGCKQQFSVLVGTIFESSHVPLAKWLLALHMMCSNKNGVAALEIKRTLNVAYKTAWFMCHRIREAMADGPLADALRLTGTVEVDETYIGGHVRNMRKSKRGTASHDPLANKTAVVTLVQRDGSARSQAMERIDGTNLSVAIVSNVDASATLMTDENPHYALVSPMLAGHERVNHSQHEYALRALSHLLPAETGNARAVND
jgi:transposase-like protein